MDDLSNEVPIKRMSVARGTLSGLPDNATIDIGSIEAAAKLAVKRAAETIPDLHPCHVAHIDVLAAGSSGTLQVTVTVQAPARGSLSGHAMAGVAAALLTARQASGADARIDGIELVQDVA